MRTRFFLAVALILALLCAVPAAGWAGDTSYLLGNTSQGGGPPPKHTAGSYTGDVILYDIRNLRKVPTWKFVDINEIINHNAYCKDQAKSFMAANNMPRYRKTGSVAANARDICAHRLGSYLLGSPIKPVSTITAATANDAGRHQMDVDLTGVCRYQTQKNVRSVCWKAVKSHGDNSVHDDSEIHTRYDSNRVPVNADATLSLNVVVWRLDTMPDPAERLDTRGFSGNVTQTKKPVFQRRIGAWDDGGTRVADVSVSADEGGCATAKTAVCWGAGEEKGSDSSRQSWWHGGNPNAGGNKNWGDNEDGPSGYTWKNNSTVGGPLDGRSIPKSGANDCVNNDVKSNLQTKQWEGYRNHNTHIGEKDTDEGHFEGHRLWRTGWTTLDYVRGFNVVKEGGWNACVWKMGSDPFYPFYPYDSGVNSYRAPSGTFKGAVDKSALPKQFESIGIAWSMPTQQRAASKIFVRIEGVPGALYLVQIYGLTPREDIKSDYVTSFLAPGPVGANPEDVIDCPCNDGTTKENGDEGTSEPVDPIPPTGLSETGTGGRFPSPLVVLTSSKQIVRTGDPVAWDIDIQNAREVKAREALFITGTSLRIGEPQISEADWAGTVSGQRYYNKGNPDAGRFKIKTPRGDKGSVTFETMAWAPFTDGAPITQTRQILFSRIPITQTAVANFGVDEPLWRGTFFTSSLLPSENEDSPQSANAGIEYESARWYEDTAPITQAQCTPVYHYNRAAGDEFIQQMAGPGIAEGYYYHHASDECRTAAGATFNPTFNLRVKGSNPIPADTKIEVRSREVDEDGKPLWTSGELVVGGPEVPVTDDAGVKGVLDSSPGRPADDPPDVPYKRAAFTADGALKLPDEDGAYRIIVTFPIGGPEWQMVTTRRGDPNDIIQWAGHASFAVPGLNGVLGPSYDPLPREGVTDSAASCGAGLPGAGFGRCVDSSNFDSVIILGNQPSH